MIDLNNYDEFKFVDELSKIISNKYPNLKVNNESKFGRFRPDIFIENNDNNAIVIEVKMLRNYSSLPFSTLNQLEDYKSYFQNAKIVLITFSHINSLMMQKIKIMNIELIWNPKTFDEIIENIFKN